MFSMLRSVQVGGVDAALDGGVLRRQAEGVEADGQEDVVAVHAHEARSRVRRRHDVPVADVQVARRVGVHREQVVAGPRLVRQVGVVEPELFPALLPARLDVRPGRSGRCADARPRCPCRKGWSWRHSHSCARGVGAPARRDPRRRRGSWMGRGGGATGTRTPDLLPARQMLSQLSYRPVRVMVPDLRPGRGGARWGTRGGPPRTMRRCQACRSRRVRAIAHARERSAIRRAALRPRAARSSDRDSHWRGDRRAAARRLACGGRAARGAP